MLVSLYNKFLPIEDCFMKITILIKILTTDLSDEDQNLVSG